MPRLRRSCVVNRRRRVQHRIDMNQRRQADNPAAPVNRNPPVIAAVNDLARLRLQHPLANAPMPQGAQQEDAVIQLPAPHCLGDMNNRCPHCAAKYFQEECNAQHIFTRCCFQGKVTLPPSQLPSNNIVELFSGDTAHSRHFLENIRHYNAAMSMASWNAALNEHAGRGPRVVTIHGQAYHLTAAQEAPHGQPPQYAQLYILDTNEAMHQRTNDPRNQNLQPHIMQLLQDELLAVNPYARQYHNMGQILQRERQIAAANNQPVRPVKMIIATRPFQDRRYANPTTTEIAAVYIGNDGAAPNPADRDLEVYPAQPNAPNTVKIKATSPNADPLTYPLLFFHGEMGWSVNIQRHVVANERQQGARRRARLTLNEFYAFKIAVRDNFSTIHLSRLLLQQYLVDAFTKIEGNELAYIRAHQLQLRVESYQGLMDHLGRRAQAEDVNVGRIVILPSSFEGSQRNMYQKYQDAMTIVTKHGKPDIFLTMTANPKWPEIQENLLPHQTASDRPDIVSRVFHLKLKELLHDVLQSHVLGHVTAYVYTIEFQKRGLPHAHMVLFLADADKPRTAQDVDRLVSAEIPDPHLQPEFHDTVKRHMMHGPCGDLDPHCVCMENGECKKHFPKPLQQQTEFSVNGYPLYRRRGQHRAQLRRHTVNDSWVVPYNPHLLMKFNCHMNVEVCTTVRSVKYIFKYIHKGNDAAHVEIRQNYLNHDEILQHLNARYVGPHQAVFRIMQYKMHDKSHIIIRLAVHLPLQQNVCYQNGNEQRALDRGQNTTLTAFFKLNQEDVNARQYLYHEIPEHYTFNQQGKKWTRRRRSTAPIIGRIYQVQPSDPQRFALRLLLLHRTGVTSFEDLRTVNAQVCATFKDAARAMGLLEDDTEHRRCLQEASVMNMPSHMRQLFATLMVFQTPSNIRALFEEFKEAMCEDYIRHDQLHDPEATLQDRHVHLCLWNIDACLRVHGKSISDVHFSDLPQLPANFVNPQNQNEHIDIVRERQLGEQMLQQLNIDQHHIHDTIVDAIATNSDQNCYFVDGPAGTGKTFLYNTVVHNLQALGIKVKCMAYSGIASTLLINGATAHSTFQIPIPLLPNSTCNIKRQSARANILRETTIFIWDEASMIPANALKAVDILLRDITQVDRPFGGKFMFLGGDFRQVLPVVPRAGREQTVRQCIINSHLWCHFHQFQLVTNMRAAQDDTYRQFSEWLLRLGTGDEPHDANDQVNLPDEIMTESLQDMINFVYPPLQPGDVDLMQDPVYMSDRCCLTPLNENSHHINDLILQQLHGPVHTYLSTDRVVTDNPEEAAAYAMEFLNAQTPSGLPKHKLELKVQY